MQQTPVKCYRCARIITRAEIEDGLVVENDLGLLCADCIARQREAARARKVINIRPEANTTVPPVRKSQEVTAEVDEDEEDNKDPVDPPEERCAELDDDEELYQDDPEAILLRILEELKPIRQAVYYHHSSLWNVLGGVIQIFAVAIIALAVVRWESGPTDFLLLGVILQLLALTCFLNGK